MTVVEQPLPVRRSIKLRIGSLLAALMSAHLYTYLIMLPLLAWIVWLRVSRQFGRQPIRRKRMLARIVLFAIIGGLLALSGLRHIQLIEGLFAGVLFGGAIGLLGLRLTRFEVDPLRGDCYVPNAWLGALLVVLLLGRLAWRFVEMWPQLQRASALAAADSQTAEMHVQPLGYASSPLTMLVIGLLVGYYIVYFSGLLIHHRRFQREQRATAV
jgi:cytochrome b561